MDADEMIRHLYQMMSLGLAEIPILQAWALSRPWYAPKVSS